MNEKLNKKKRRPTETKGNATNVTEYTSSINTEDSTYSDEDSNNACATRSSGYGTMSNGQRISADATIATARDSEGSSLASSTSNDASCKAVCILIIKSRDQIGKGFSPCLLLRVGS